MSRSSGALIPTRRISPMIEVTGASTGAVTSSGSWAATGCSRSLTVCRARKMSVPQSKSTHTMLIPCAELDRTRRTPAAPFTAVSTGKVTRLSTSSGASPCASVSTVTVGAVRSGKTSTGSVAATQPPPARSTAATLTVKKRCSSEARTSRSRTPGRPDGAPLNAGDRGRRSRRRRAKRASPDRRRS